MLTQTAEQLSYAVNSSAFFPHPDVRRGTLAYAKTDECKAFAGRETLVNISSQCLLDLTGDIVIEPWVMIGKFAKLYTHTHEYRTRVPLLLAEELGQAPVSFDNKHISRDVWIHESIILPKCTFIAEGVVIGAGAIVTRNIDEPYTIWAGNPARIVGRR